MDPTPLRASAFEVVDADGRTRARLGGRPDGSTALDFWDAEGTYRAGLGEWHTGGASLELSDAEGAYRTGVGVWPGGVSGVELAGADRRARARLARLGDDEASLRFFDAAGRPVGDSGAGPEG